MGRQAMKLLSLCPFSMKFENVGRAANSTKFRSKIHAIATLPTQIAEIVVSPCYMPK
jgi:hypothetical protein